MAAPTSVHLVGSTKFPDSTTAFHAFTRGLPALLHRVPDGETGERHYFTLFQASAFSAAPEVLVNFENNVESQAKTFTEEEVKEGVRKLQEANPKGLQTGYDVAARESYAVFERLKAEEVIPQRVRFQVGLPTAASTIGPLIQKAFQPSLAPLYESALISALRNIQASIPHDQLSIQLDLAVDMAYWEGQYLKPWFDNIKETVVGNIVRMMAEVEPDVELGVHFCYGDMEHRHWFEPPTLSGVSSLLTRLLASSPHPINYIHFPIPVSAQSNLPSFLAPFASVVPKLVEQGVEVYVGVVQFDDEQGTRERIAAVSKAWPEMKKFGIATECGWGRTPEGQAEGIMGLMSEGLCVRERT